MTCAICRKEVCVCRPSPKDKSASELSHSCKNVCSGWRAGYDAAVKEDEQDYMELRDFADTLMKQNAALTAEVAELKADQEESVNHLIAATFTINKLKEERDELRTELENEKTKVACVLVNNGKLEFERNAWKLQCEKLAEGYAFPFATAKKALAEFEKFRKERE